MTLKVIRGPASHRDRIAQGGTRAAGRWSLLPHARGARAAGRPSSRGRRLWPARPYDWDRVSATTQQPSTGRPRPSERAQRRLPGRDGAPVDRGCSDDWWRSVRSTVFKAWTVRTRSRPAASPFGQMLTGLLAIRSRSGLAGQHGCRGRIRTRRRGACRHPGQPVARVEAGRRLEAAVCRAWCAGARRAVPA